MRGIEALEALPGPLRLGLTWLLCLLPRALAAVLLGVTGDYRVFADPAARTESFWYPAYHALARGLWAASGGTLTLHVAGHLAVHALLGPLVYAGSRQLGLTARSAWLAVLGVALLPYYVSASARQPQVGVVLVLVAGVLWLFARWQASGYAWRGAVGFALLSGLSTLLRPNLLLSCAALYALALGGELAHRAAPAHRAAARRILASGLGVALLLAGMAAGSRALTGSYSPFPPVVGHNLYVGHNPRTGEYLRRHDVESAEDAVRDHGYPPAIAAIEDERERDAALRREALAFAAEHPGETLRNTGLKLWRYWDLRLEDAERNPALWNLAYSVPYAACLVLGLLGAARMARQQPRALLVIATLLLSYWLPHVVMFPTIRMRMTTEFLLVMLAASAVDGWLPPRAQRQVSRR